MSSIEEIKERSNIVEVISEAIPLKQAGSRYKGLCPFHGEKTPSFVVSEENQFYHCFGCGVSGDVIEFVKAYYHLDFLDAVEKLAQRAGLTFEKSGENQEKNKVLYEMNVEAARFFFRSMYQTPNPALPYMEQRGISLETLKTFGVGFADDRWNSLLEHMKKQGYSEEELYKVGLISQSKGKYYDKYRNRVMFPIINTRGKIIGFGGRALGDENPKYLNSPESPIFQKKNNLFALQLTRNAISKEDRGILVEGYMDVIALYQKGVTNVTASLGTALTPQQAKMLKRYSHHVVISYDGDKAGKKAAWRAMDILHREGCKVKVLTLPGGQDPDDFVKKNGGDQYKEGLDRAPDFAEYQFQVLAQTYDLEQTQGRIEFLKAAVKVLKKLSPVECDLYIKILARDHHISEGALYRELNQEKGTIKPDAAPSKKETKQENPLTLLEKNLLKILLTDSRFLEKDIDFSQLFQSPGGKIIFDAMKSQYRIGEELDIKQLLDGLPEQEQRELEDLERNIFLGENREQVFEDCLKKIRLRQWKAREQWLLEQLEVVDEEEYGEEIRQWTRELMQVQEKIRLGGTSN